MATTARAGAAVGKVERSRGAMAASYRRCAPNRNVKLKLQTTPQKHATQLSDLRLRCRKSTAQPLGRARLIPIFKGPCPGAKHAVRMTRVALSCIPLHLPAHGKLQKFPCRGEQLSWVTWNYRLSRLVRCWSQDMVPVLLRTENNLLLLMTCLLSLIRD